MNELMLDRMESNNKVRSSYLRSAVSRRQPYLVDEIEEMLGLHVVVTPDTIEISQRTSKSACDHRFRNSASAGLVSQRATGTDPSNQRRTP